MTFLKGKRSLDYQNKLLLKLRNFVILCGLILGGGVLIYAQTEFNYRNFKVDVSQLKDATQKDTIIKAIKRQIEIVGQTKISEDALNFFKSVPIVMLPPDSGMPGVYGKPGKSGFNFW